jgi:hypothetical protein
MGRCLYLGGLFRHRARALSALNAWTVLRPSLELLL